MRQLLFLTSLLAIMSCAHYPDVIPGDKGLHTVRTHKDEPGSARRYALEQAKDYCGESDKKPAVVTEKTEYKGTMKEEEYRKYKMGSKAAMVGGGAATIFGGKTVKQVGGVAAVGGAAGDAALGQPYQTSMKFKCK